MFLVFRIPTIGGWPDCAAICSNQYFNGIDCSLVILDAGNCDFYTLVEKNVDVVAVDPNAFGATAVEVRQRTYIHSAWSV